MEKFKITVKCKECNRPLVNIPNIGENKVLVIIKGLEAGMADSKNSCPEHPGRLFKFQITDGVGGVIPRIFFQSKKGNEPNQSTETM